MSTSIEVPVGQIGSATAGEHRTAKAMLRWFRTLSPKEGRSLAREHRKGILSDHEVIRYIENEAAELLPEGYFLTCEPVYGGLIALDDLGQPIPNKKPEGYVYSVEECIEDDEEDEEVPEEEQEHWLPRKSSEGWLEPGRFDRRRRRIA